MKTPEYKRKGRAEVKCSTKNDQENTSTQGRTTSTTLKYVHSRCWSQFGQRSSLVAISFLLIIFFIALCCVCGSLRLAAATNAPAVRLPPVAFIEAHHMEVVVVVVVTGAPVSHYCIQEGVLWVFSCFLAYLLPLWATCQQG